MREANLIGRSSRRRRTLYACSAMGVVGLAGCTRAPMNYLAADGPAAKPVADLGWGLTAISCLTCIIIAGLILAALFRKRPAVPADVAAKQVFRHGNGLRWVYWGTAVSVVFLFGSAVWMLVAMADVIRPERTPAFTIRVVGHQWWWELRYLDPQGREAFVTANEIHVPVGAPVRLELLSADVIHSFWIPKLAGKMDIIPGQLNTTWIESSVPGVYRGQCAEYCGKQHANMILSLVAQPQADFDAWWKAQQQPAPAPAQEVAAGYNTFVDACGRCHTVKGTPADGRVGPDLTHLMQRAKIGSNMIPNNTGHLGGWIADAPQVKPGVWMPAMGDKLPGPQLKEVLAYVETLR